MTRTILVTVGVSLVRDKISEKESLDVGFERLAGYHSSLQELYEELDIVVDRRHARKEKVFNPEERTWVKSRQSLIETLGNLWGSSLSEREKRLYSGAELASLTRLGQGNATPFAPLQSDDRVILLASDTASGIFCANLICEVLKTEIIGLPRVEAEVKLVSGLQPEDAELFLAQGLPEAARLIFKHHQPGQQTLLVVTGGYKGLLPYLSPVAMHLKIPMLYLYEDTDEPVEIRPLPVKFDLDIVRKHGAAFALVRPGVIDHSRREIRAEEFWNKVSETDERDESAIRDLGLMEEFELQNEPRVARLSATGILAWLLVYDEEEAQAPETPGGPLV
jgi:putative CRISPR-associated protein (TIGR02619 family)